jgi:signal transduction histidine kinase
MRLVPKLALSLFAGVFVVVVGFTTWRVRRDIELFDEDARRDQRVVGVTAAAALSRHRTLDDAVRLARRVDTSRESIEVRYVILRDGAPPALRPLVTVRAQDLSVKGPLVQVVSPKTGSASADTLLTYVAAPVSDESSGAIELSQPLASRAEYAWKGVWSALASSLAMLLVGGAIMALIGARIVGRPVADLISATRRIGEGNFDVLAATRRQDELGELAQALRAMSQDLASARSRARTEAEARIQALEQLRHAERLSTLGQLASVLAHEIGTPLNVIAGHGKLIEGGRLPANGIKESATAIGEQCGRITRIIRRILDYARRNPPKRLRISAADVVGQTRAMLRSLADQKEVTIALDLPPSPTNLEILADPDQLQQALTNVVMNAVHASPRGSEIRLRVRIAQHDHEGRSEERLAIAVHDAGPGIDPALEERIFEPFFTTKPAGEGTGLGLSVARDIVREHGGSIAVHSASGEGTTFEIYLPQQTMASSLDAGPLTERSP